MLIEIYGDIIYIKHEEQSVLFEIGYYKKNIHPEMFDIINHYFGELPKETQSELFKMITETSTVLRSPSIAVTESSSILSNIMSEFYNTLNIDSVIKWTEEKSVYHIPSELRSDPGRFNPDTTYLIAEYKGLLDLSTILKPALPILGAFISKYKESIGNDHKEQIALTILSSSIVDLEEYKKLYKFVEATSATSKAKGTINSVAGCLGTSTLVEWALADVIVRRVVPAVCSLPGDSLIRKIHGHLVNNVRPISLDSRGRSARGGVRLIERSLTKKGKPDDDKIGVSDSHKLKQLFQSHIPIVAEKYILKVDINDNGEIITEYPDDLRKLILAAYPEYPDNAYIPIRSDVEKIEGINIRKHHIQILALLFRRVINPKIISMINHKAVCSLLVASQCILASMGFEALAQLMTASNESVEENIMLDMAFTPLTVDIQKSLSTIYRHYSPNNKRQSHSKLENVNIAIEFIESTISDLVKLRHYYKPAIPIGGNNIVNTYFRMPPTLKCDLANMLIAINTRIAKK